MSMKHLGLYGITSWTTGKQEAYLPFNFCQLFPISWVIYPLRTLYLSKIQEKILLEVWFSIGQNAIQDRELSQPPGIPPPKTAMFRFPFTAPCLAAQQQGGPRGVVTSGHKQLCSCGHLHIVMMALGFPGGSSNKESDCNAGDLGSIPGLGRSPGGGHGNPLQCSGLENPMDRGGWRTMVHGVTRVRHDWAAEKSAAHDGMFLPCVCVCVCALSHVWLFGDPVDDSSPGSSVHGIFPARILEQKNNNNNPGANCRFLL